MLKGIDLPAVHALALRAVEKKFKAQGFSFPHWCPYSLEQIVGPDVWRKLNY
jgi:hypothetical protein